MQTLANVNPKEVSVMIIQEAIELFRQHQKTTVKKSTLKSYGKFLEQFQVRFSKMSTTVLERSWIRRQSTRLSSMPTASGIV